jgi:hypothetical protein
VNQRSTGVALLALCGLALVGLFCWRPPEPARRPPQLGASGARSPSGESPALESLRARPAVSDGGLPPAARPTRAEFASLSWGDGPSALGKKVQQEGNPEGPMSLTADPGGRVYVVDQVNGRLLKLDKSGQPAGSLPLAVQAAQDVAVARDGTVAVLDRLVDKTVSLTGPDGKPLGELHLEGKNLPEGGAATGLFLDGDQVYAEREHGDLVKLGTTKGVADAERGTVPGRPSRDGQSFLSAGIADGPGGVLTVTAIDRPGLGHRFTRQYSLAASIVSIVLLDSDSSGIIYLGVLQEGGAQAAPGFSVTVLCLDPLDGRPLGRSALPASTGPEETFRDFTVLDQGGGLYLYRTESGAQLLRFGCG